MKAVAGAWRNAGPDVAAADGMRQIEVAGAVKRFGQVIALDRVDLAVATGEFFALLGGSGCGKSTLLRVIAGFTRPDAGAIKRAGVDITDMAAAARNMGFVFQSYALFPTKTVFHNLAFSLRIRGVETIEIRRRVGELAALAEIENLLDRYPHELSGGQQQRVALARALAPSPDLLLLDEPLSALDARIRARLREEIRDIVKRVGASAIYVTHDQEEALAIADRVGVMDAGRIVQIGTPSEIYDRPTTRFVAAFVGTMNFLPAALEGRNRVRIGRIVVPIAGAHGYSDDAQVVAAVRPEDITLTPTTDDADGTVSRVVFLGSVRRVHVKFGRHDIMADIPGSDERTSTLRLGAAVRVGFVPLKVLLFDRQDQGDS